MISEVLIYFHLPKKILEIESTIPKINAAKNPSTTKPVTILLAKSINKAFKTKVNSPKVKIFMGRVRIINIGFRKALIIPKTNATARAAVKPLR